MTPEERSRIMASIHSKNTKPELIVRKFLWSRGFRYRLNHPRLPGKPDVVLLKYRACIFVNGCFWHGHMLPATDGSYLPCPLYATPRTRVDYWTSKIARNQQRDARVVEQLAEMGWTSITIWECQLKPATREATLQALEYALCELYLKEHRPYASPSESQPQPLAAEPETPYGN